MTPAVAHALDVLDDRVKLTAATVDALRPASPCSAPTRSSTTTGSEVIDGLAAVCDEVEVAGSGYRHWSMRPEARRLVLQIDGHATRLHDAARCDRGPPGRPLRHLPARRTPRRGPERC